MKKALVFVLGSLLLSGCTVRVADLTVASTKNYNLNSSKFLKGKRVMAEDSYPVILLSCYPVILLSCYPVILLSFFRWVYLMLRLQQIVLLSKINAPLV